MSKNSLLQLDDDSLMEIIQHLELTDHTNFGSTCCRLRDITNTISRRKYKHIVVNANNYCPPYAKKILSRENFDNAFTVKLGSYEMAHVHTKLQIIIFYTVRIQQIHSNNIIYCQITHTT